jgi:2-oxo-hept-3-ene-1,7-dioate hydratase
VLAGSFVRPIAARSGDTFHIDFGPHGAISCHFA